MEFQTRLVLNVYSLSPLSPSLAGSIGKCELTDVFLRRSFSITLQMIAAGEWKWKWSNSVLKSEMGIFLCISITNNVKSYKKFDGKAQTAKFTVFAREISSTALKTWKTRKTKTWITQNFQILYHIQGTTMWKSTSSAFQKCGTFCVYDFLKGSYWLSKFSNISIFYRP